MPDGSIILMGGVGPGLKNDVWRSTNNGATWTQVTAAAGWTARYQHASVAMPDGSIVLMGGYRNIIQDNDVWRLNTVGSSLQNPSHTYSSAGIYNVTLQAYNTGGYNSTRKTGYITVNSPPTPVHNLNSGKNFTTIQAAINDATTLTGHTILVDSGLYHENVYVTKSITLRGNDTGTGFPIVDAGNPENGFWIDHDGTTLENFTVINSSSSPTRPGIYVFNSNHNIIRHVNVSNGYQGIDIYNSTNTTVFNVWGSNNSQPLVRARYSNNLRFQNISTNASHYDINVQYSHHILVENCSIINYYKQGVGISIYSSFNNTITNNFISGPQEGIRLEYSSGYNTVTNNTFRNGSYGVSNFNNNNSIFSDNIIENNTWGISNSGPNDNNNTILRNLIQDNQQTGI
jgi:parallel beta-helix repeat protein